MHSELNRAQALLEQGNYTCVLCQGEQVFTDNRKGIRPLLELLDRHGNFPDFCAADKVVGKAAAFLYRLMGVKAVYAKVVSKPAARVLAEGGILLEYETLVDAIRDRTGTGFCPMEAAVMDIRDPKEALIALRQRLTEI